MFVRNCWYVAGWDYELTADKPISRTVINEPIVLYRTADGAVVGMEDRCCHRGAPLSLGRLEGDDLRCMYHGLKFNRSGRCIEIPGQDQIPATACVKTYPVVQRHSWIWVWMGDAAAADPALIPPAVGFDDPDWILGSGQMDYEANYLLINDNLTDFSHLSYVHANSFGATEIWARTRPNITRLERGIRVQRWISGGVSEGVTRADRRAPDGMATEHWQSYDYLAPGVLLMQSATYPRGAQETFGGGEPDPSVIAPVSRNFTSQAVTPLTDRTSRYFFSWGPHASEGTKETAEAMMKVANMAFTEDRIMIEAQQRTLDTTPPRKDILTSADVGPMQMRSVLERLIRAENAAVAAE
jgi:vanillate O-demethylase monooxygenase subunit